MSTKLLLPEPPKLELGQALIDNYLKEGIAEFASGETANNHLDIGGLEVEDRHFNKLCSGYYDLLQLSGVEKPAFVASVPAGADYYVSDLVKKLSTGFRYNPEALFFTRPKGERRTFIPDNEVEYQVKKMLKTDAHPKGIVLDDASSNGGTSEAMAEFLENDFGLEVLLIMSGFYRGRPESLQSKYRRAAVVARHIPLMMDWDSYRKGRVIVEQAA